MAVAAHPRALYELSLVERLHAIRQREPDAVRRYECRLITSDSPGPGRKYLVIKPRPRVKIVVGVLIAGRTRLA